MQGSLNAPGQKFEHTMNSTIEILKDYLYVALTLLGKQVALILIPDGLTHLPWQPRPPP